MMPGSVTVQTLEHSCAQRQSGGYNLHRPQNQITLTEVNSQRRRLLYGTNWSRGDSTKGNNRRRVTITFSPL